MYYYYVHLPLSIAERFVYRSAEKLSPGLRVVVSFNRKLQLGITGDASKLDPKPGIRYLEIEEVLDDTALINPGIWKLAVWMADYYKCSLGKVLFACLPSLLQPDLQMQCRWISEQAAPPRFEPLYQLLADGTAQSLSSLHKAKPKLHVYKLAEEAEAEGLIELLRSLSHKDKQKTVNYIRLLSPDEEVSGLPAKQLQAYAIIKAAGHPVPMAELAAEVSYYSLKALVKKGIIEIFPKKIEHSGMPFEKSDSPKQIVLNDEQMTAVTDIRARAGSFDTNLLYGITGSGKTEVYLEIIRDYLSQDKGVIFLIPEIALTPQMVDRFSASFGDTLAIMHSQLTERERLKQWKRIKSGDCRMVIGARSAILAPIRKLGLIIVDEEHEQSYKQDSNPRYNGRDMAIVRAQIEGAQVILGSATPSLESWHNAQNQRYRLHTLSKRPLSYELPRVEILNLCDEEGDSMISPLLLNAIDQRLQKQQQVILFQNRRGYSSFLQCQKCGELIKCTNCEISMYYHRDREEMHCHYCGNVYPSPRKCPSCGSFSFSYGAAGTQKLEQILSLLFPDARLLRMDSDSSRQRDRYKTMYDRMKRKEVDILLGTQMISKGLDFPGVTLVGIVNADISLNVPDFRAAERTFQLLTQVAGRSGRGEQSGEVIIQTYNPDHYAIVHASRQDYPGFAAEELSYRKRLYYPPFYRLARILYQAKDLSVLLEEMNRLSGVLSDVVLRFPAGQLLILGPAPAPFSRLNNLFRYHLILKASSPGILKDALAQVESRFPHGKAISSAIDIDPMSLM
ncbi:MAG: primosomal protein N' [Candidatus Cloacimonetes bacterium HGW-Cloacimonetes-2]|jgi:primosomal protein N' (replication factor Y)|nr:MAG: primosomal protein N' [Candidatus Cloacimonetes bacterium HGW-Cloacimonetes-2]